ncbi:hypothetical protein TRFO_30556 [Tritrichomonas foetus]|uniref:Uncharacterized protein n=1 Tax=Tritrichomonas foetus TaxID=1144522 RepID=A0A1J4JXU9_9EUKA|nr:hypothetical protein TRFO_30556 [Tritrichomonas foetus]|eukprot:OHT02364.1 hypothetical protein TRFO_30556 [Tritrichomonas foetus]
MSSYRSGRSRSAASGSTLYDEFRATAILPLRRYILMTGESNEPFGFGSSSPARPKEKFSDYPGPGRYDPHECMDHTESLRGIGTGFTSIVPRKVEYFRGNKNPEPSRYNPHGIDRKIKPTIGIIPKGKGKITCFPDEREAFNTPGPGSYNLPHQQRRAPTAVFKSKTERNYLPGPKAPPPRFDGRNLILRISE